MTETKNEATLYDRIGGKAAVEAAVDVFYDKVLADERVAGFFEGVDMKEQRGKQKRFLAHVFGAPTPYDGKSLREAHAPLVEKGLGEEHFGAIAEHLVMTLGELNVPAEITAEVMAIAASTHDDVLGL